MFTLAGDGSRFRSDLLECEGGLAEFSVGVLSLKKNHVVLLGRDSHPFIVGRDTPVLRRVLLPPITVFHRRREP